MRHFQGILFPVLYTPLHLHNRLKKFSFKLLLLAMALFLSPQAKAFKDIDCYIEGGCDRSTSSSASSQIKINPSAVPTEEGLGLEGIYYRNEMDLSLVRGNGRMGA